MNKDDFFNIILFLFINQWNTKLLHLLYLTIVNLNELETDPLGYGVCTEQSHKPSKLGKRKTIITFTEKSFFLQSNVISISMYVLKIELQRRSVKMCDFGWKI